AQIVEVAFFMGHGDQPPVAVSGGNFESEDRGGLFIGLSGCGGHGGDRAGERCNCNQRENNPSHLVAPSNMHVGSLTAAMMRRRVQPELPQATCWSQSEHAPNHACPDEGGKSPNEDSQHTLRSGFFLFCS